MKILHHLRFTAVLALGLAAGLAANAQTKLYGTVKSGTDAVPSAKIQVMKGELFVSGTMADQDGKYSVSGLEPGTYVVKVFDGTQTVSQSVTLGIDEYRPLEFQMIAGGGGDDDGPGVSHGTVVIQGARDQVFTLDPKQTWGIDRTTIMQGTPGRGINDIVSTAPGMVQKDAGDPLNFRGGRSDANATYVDGRKVRGSDEMPLGSIEQVTVVTGGLPAEYGDVTGAVIAVTTRNPGMYMGHVGKPLSKEERKQLKLQRKKGTQQGIAPLEVQDLACN